MDHSYAGTQKSKSTLILSYIMMLSGALLLAYAFGAFRFI